MITAVRSLAFDLLRAIDESSPTEALEHSITVAEQRIRAYRTLNRPDRVPDILCDALSIDVIERSAPERFVFSEERERNAKDGTDKEALAHRQVTHAVLKKLKRCVLGKPPFEHDASYSEIERCFRVWSDAQYDRYQYRVAHRRQRHARGIDSLSGVALATLRGIASPANGGLHRQALDTLSRRGLIKPSAKNGA